jgi:hypothetical protein
MSNKKQVANLVLADGNFDMFYWLYQHECYAGLTVQMYYCIKHIGPKWIEQLIIGIRLYPQILTLEDNKCVRLAFEIQNLEAIAAIILLGRGVSDDLLDSLSIQYDIRPNSPKSQEIQTLIAKIQELYEIDPKEMRVQSTESPTKKSKINDQKLY